MAGHAAFAHSQTNSTVQAREVNLRAGDVILTGELTMPRETAGVVLFAHGSGSSRHSPRNQAVAQIIRQAGLGTLLFDLLTPAEETSETVTGDLRFNIDLCAERLINATYFLKAEFDQAHIGYFGASIAAAGALIAGAELGTIVSAIVTRAGRPDLAADSLPLVKAPTLQIVGSLDHSIVELNQLAAAQLQCENDVAIVPCASHLFEEPGALDNVARLATNWFHRHLTKVDRVVP